MRQGHSERETEREIEQGRGTGGGGGVLILILELLLLLPVHSRNSFQERGHFIAALYPRNELPAVIHSNVRDEGVMGRWLEFRGCHQCFHQCFTPGIKSLRCIHRNIRDNGPMGCSVLYPRNEFSAVHSLQYQSGDTSPCRMTGVTTPCRVTGVTLKGCVSPELGIKVQWGIDRHFMAPTDLIFVSAFPKEWYPCKESIMMPEIIISQEIHL